MIGDAYAVILLMDSSIDVAHLRSEDIGIFDSVMLARYSDHQKAMHEEAIDDDLILRPNSGIFGVPVVFGCGVGSDRMLERWCNSKDNNGLTLENRLVSQIRLPLSTQKSPIYSDSW